MDPKEILVAMREFIWHFFGCRDCANHFIVLAANVENEITNGKEQVLWLWQGHNKVNKRLKGDMTEDPLHPKIQFPSNEVCPECRAGNAQAGSKPVFDKGNVFEFLEDFYSEGNIIESTNHDMQSTTVVTNKRYFMPVF